MARPKFTQAAKQVLQDSGVVTSETVEPAEVVEASTPEPEFEVSPEAVKGKILCRSVTGGFFHNPFTGEEVGNQPEFMTNDGWLASQMDAKKIVKV